MGDLAVAKVARVNTTHRIIRRFIFLSIDLKYIIIGTCIGSKYIRTKIKKTPLFATH